MNDHFLYSTNVVDCVDSGVFVVDKDFTVHLWNQFMGIHSKYSEDEIIGLNLFECFDELPKKWFERKIKSVFLLNNQSYTSWEQRPYLFKFSNGRSVTGGAGNMYQNCCFTPICDKEDKVLYVCISIKDVTDNAISTMKLKEVVTELERMIRIDGLTQLQNRSHWELGFQNEVKRIDRYGGEVSLIMFDVDHFKLVNDQYGHLCGDEVLREISRRTMDLFRSVDVIGRYGGEEFCVFLPETDIEKTAILAEKLRKKICELPIHYKSFEVNVSISVGFTTSLNGRKNHEQLLNEADIALYQAKTDGRNKSVNFLNCPPNKIKEK